MGICSFFKFFCTSTVQSKSRVIVTGRCKAEPAAVNARLSTTLPDLSVLLSVTPTGSPLPSVILRGGGKRVRGAGEHLCDSFCRASTTTTHFFGRLSATGGAGASAPAPRRLACRVLSDMGASAVAQAGDEEVRVWR